MESNKCFKPGSWVERNRHLSLALYKWRKFGVNKTFSHKWMEKMLIWHDRPILLLVNRYNYEPIFMYKEGASRSARCELSLALSLEYFEGVALPVPYAFEKKGHAKSHQNV
jgi:hypothetical protein